MFSKKETRTERVTFRLSKDELQKLDEISEKLKEKRSDFIRIAVLERINKKKINKKRADTYVPTTVASISISCIWL